MKAYSGNGLLHKGTEFVKFYLMFIKSSLNIHIWLEAIDFRQHSKHWYLFYDYVLPYNQKKYKIFHLHYFRIKQIVREEIQVNNVRLKLEERLMELPNEGKLL